MKKTSIKGNFFIISIILLILIVIGLGWYKYVYEKDYWLYSLVSCDPNTESCFFDEEFESHYKIAQIKAYAAPACDGWDDKCMEISCESLSAADCQIFTCDDENIDRFDIETECASGI